MATKNLGKEFEAQFQKSCASVKPKVFFYRLKDQSLPPDLRSRVPVSRNKYDCIMFDSGHLLTLELKSTGQKSVSFDEKIIKQHQIDNLIDAATYPNVISGFLINFREFENFTFFIHINEFVKYKQAAQTESKEHTYVKLNKSSIPLEVCEHIGIKINNYKMKTKYHYHIREFISEAIKKFGE